MSSTLKLFVIFLILFSITYRTEAGIMERPWFSNKNCSCLEVKKLKSISQRKVIKSIKIEDPHVIQNFMARIEEIPANGDMMKSFGPQAEEIDLVFYCGDQSQTIEIFNQQFKTPSTGFNSERKEIEEHLYSDINTLLFPGLK